MILIQVALLREHQHSKFSVIQLIYGLQTVFITFDNSNTTKM